MRELKQLMGTLRKLTLKEKCILTFNIALSLLTVVIFGVIVYFTWPAMLAMAVMYFGWMVAKAILKGK